MTKRQPKHHGGWQLPIDGIGPGAMTCSSHVNSNDANAANANVGNARKFFQDRPNVSPDTEVGKNAANESILRFGLPKLFKNNDVKVFTMSVEQGADLKITISKQEQARKVKFGDGDVFYKCFNDLPVVGEALLKTVKVHTYRQLFSGFVEIEMLNRAYNAVGVPNGDSEWERNLSGAEFFCKPFFVCPILKKNVWRLGIAMERAPGMSLSTLPKSMEARYNLYAAVERAIISMWLLGFAHSDLHHKNIIYAMNGDNVASVKIIDTESMVDLRETGVVELMKIKMSEKGISFASDAFCSIMRPKALKKLAAAFKFCTQFGDKENFLSCPDQNFLPNFYYKLFKGKADQDKVRDARQKAWGNGRLHTFGTA